ncbi:MAG: FHA domain-containing protein [Thermoguttaceae bacterium]
MEVKLIVASGNIQGQEVQVTGPRFFIGRAEDCHLRPRSDLISRHHCAILVDEDFVAVRDFGSKNGTYVNNQRVTGETELKAGDRLRVGAIDFEVLISAEAAAHKDAPAASKKAAGEKPAGEKPAAAEKAAAAIAESVVEKTSAIETKVGLGGPKKPKVQSVQEAAKRTVQSAGSSKDDDVSAWLDDEPNPMAETTTMDPTQTVDTAKVEKEKLGKSAPPAGPQEEEPIESEEEPDKPKTDPFHVAGASKKQDSGTSKDAAADMLKKFFRQ